MTLDNIHILKACKVILFHHIAAIYQYCIYSYAVELIAVAQASMLLLN